jgi:hypothetical protein
MPRKETLSLLAVDLLLVIFGWWLAFWLRFNLDVPAEFSDLAWRSGPWVLLSFALGLSGARVYRQVWRHIGLPELRQLGVGVVIGGVVSAAAHGSLKRWSGSGRATSGCAGRVHVAEVSAGAPGPVASVANALTTGVVDIRGVTPTGASSDRDALTGVMAGTVIVVPTMGSTTEGQWVLRTLGTGLIAYVSNGEAGPMSAHPAWTTTTPTAAGAYNAAVRNFVAAAVGTARAFRSVRSARMHARARAPSLLLRLGERALVPRRTVTHVRLD